MKQDAARLALTRTWTLYVGGQFIRSAANRTQALTGLQGKTLGRIARAGREDFHEAVAAARRAQGSWSRRTAANRGQILYRIAEHLEGRAAEVADALAATQPGGLRAARQEVGAAVDRLVCFAGWSDKFAQVLGSHNPVAGPFYNFTVPEAAGVVGVLAPEEPALLGLISLLAPPLCAGNTVVALASGAHPLTAALFGEVCGAADLPHGVLNLLAGRRAELAPHFASHRDVDALHAAGCSRAERRMLDLEAAGNLKRVSLRELSGAEWLQPRPCEGPGWIEPFLVMKTIWHPSSA
jgi:acyl-CoA reductase-like NAD-dependent aldehyde dehydrogenase